MNKFGVYIRILLIGIIFLYSIALIIPSHWNWFAFDTAGKYVGLLVMACVLFLTLIPQISKAIYRPLNSFLLAIKKNLRKLPSGVKAALWIIIPGGIFYVLKSNSYILGDGHTYAGTVVDRTLISPATYAYSFLLGRLADIFGINQASQALELMAAISIVCGIVFVYFVYLTIELLISDSETKLFAFIMAITSGMIVLFTGYVESYPILIAWLSIYIYYSVRYVHGQGNMGILIAVFLLGVFWHLWFIAFAPSLMYVLNRRFRIVSTRVIIGLAALYVLGIYFGGQIVHRGGLYISLPIAANADTSYTLFDPMHFIDYFNEILIVGPVLVLMALLLLSAIGRIDLKAEHKFLLFAGIPAMFMSFIIDPVIGAVRDWDLLSIFGLPLILLALTLFMMIARKNSALKYLVIPILLLGLFHTGSFIANNKNPDRALDRVVRVIWNDKHYQSTYYKGAKILPFTTLLANIYGRNEQAAQFLERRIDPGSGDVLAMAAYAFNQKDYEKASEYYSLLYGKYEMKPEYKFSYGRSLLMTRKPDRAIPVLKDALRDTIFYDLCFDLGASYILTMHPDSAFKYFQSGLINNPDSAQGMSKYVTFLEAGRLAGFAAFYQSRLLAIYPDSSNIRNKLIKLFRQAGMTDSAEYYLDYTENKGQ